MSVTNLRAPTRHLEPLILAPLRRAPLVSVLLTNYNYARFLGYAIESVLNQTYAAWELVICDDGSTDGSASLIRSYLPADPRISLFEKPNGGHTSALNLAFSKCCGDVLCLLDSDDLFTPEKLERLVEIYLQDSQIGMVTHRVIRVDQGRHRQGVYPLSSFPDGWVAQELLESGGILPCAPPTSAISFRREVADHIFPISTVPPLHMCPDQVIMRVAPLITSIMRAPLALAEHRVHDGNSYSVRGVSLPAVSKQLQLSRALWQEQHRFLADINPDVAVQLADHDESPSAGLLRYIEAKLCREPQARAFLAKYLAISEQRGESKWSLFWRLSIYLPNVVFEKAVSTLLGHGALKQFVTRLRRLT